MVYRAGSSSGLDAKRGYAVDGASDLPPKRLTRSGLGVWALSDWIFYAKTNVVEQPYYKFADTAVTLTPSATTGTITLTSSVGIFEAGHDDTRLRVAGKEVLITNVDSPTVVTATVIETLVGDAGD